jgi:glucoamylase
MKKILILVLLPQIVMASLPSKEFQFKASVKTLIENSTKPDVFPGFVVASPSRHDPDYYFDWLRDTALVMRTLVDYWEITRDPKIKQMLLTWVDAEEHRQTMPTLAGLGEVKFNIDGTAFIGPWGRPQNDGPALRAIAMIKFARMLLAEGESHYVVTRLYSGVLPADTVIKRDLEYSAHHWRDQNFDPWEEEMGEHFYNLMAQHTALQEGAKLARELGDLGAADFYTKQSKAIGEYIKRGFLDEHIGIRVSRNVSRPLGYKNSGLDVAPLLALNHTWPYQQLFGWGHPNVKKYVQTLRNTFAQIYSVNHRYPDIGVAIGRYPEDMYDGYHTQGVGNPWFLSTLALGEHYCLANGGRHNELAEKQFLRAIFHSDRKGRMDEQINLEHGIMQGARELTWSHGAFMTAMMRCGLVKRVSK